MKWKLTEEEGVKVNKGELCPECKSSEVQVTGGAPDGFEMNYSYKCTCGCEWEGY
jgi:hypothetical protein